MFQTLKQKFLTFISPVSSREEDVVIVQGSRARKRRQIDSDPDCQIINPGKRKKLTISSLKWAFDYVIGKTHIHSDNRLDTIEQRMAKKDSEIIPVPDCETRNVLTPARRLRSQQRTGLKQISNSTVLDLTQPDDESDNEVQVTKVTYDLSDTDHKIDTSLRLEGMNTTPGYTTRTPPQRNSPLRTVKVSPKSRFLTESFRLEEKKRYKELVAQFTTITLPDYSESISPTHSPVSSPLFSTDLTTTENIHTSPLFYNRSFQKPIAIDLTRNESVFHKQKKSYVDLTYIEPDLEVVEVRKVKTKSNERKLNESNSVLNLDWIQKWRDTLDPMQLERDRRIQEEERKSDALKKKQLEEFEKLTQQQESQFPELTNDILNKVKRALAPGNPKEVFVEGFNAEITRGDISTLRDSTWLNDEVVNFYFNLLMSRSKANNDLPKVHIFNTFFYPKIMKTGHAGVKRWTRKVDIFAVDVILIPVHLGMHWVLAVIDFKNKEIVYYDSLKGNNSSCIQGLKKYLSDESLDKKKKSFDFTDWKELMPKDIPEQMNGCDCGVFMCKYAEYKSRYAKFTFTQDNMPYFRKRMIHEILSKELM